MKKRTLKFLFSSLLILFFSHLYAQPKVSIITSLYKGEKYIDHFLEDISKQTIYKDCEHIIINANSPEEEEPIILKYAKKFPNIRYIKLREDPGLYAVWNIGLVMSNAEFITNANVDDRYSYSSIEKLLNFLEKNPGVDLVYSDLIFTSDVNTPFHSCNIIEYHQQPEFSVNNVIHYCSPGNHPLWRKSMHFKYGLFDTAYKINGDHEMWIRAASKGGVFKRYPEYLGAFYCGDTNLSLSPEKKLIRAREYKMLRKQYRKIWPSS